MNKVMTLSTDGILDTNETILAKLHQYYLISDKIQSTLFYGKIKNYKEISGNYNSDIDALLDAIKEDYEDYLYRQSYYSTVTAEITYDEDNKSIVFNVKVVTIDGDSVQLSDTRDFKGELDE